MTCEGTQSPSLSLSLPRSYPPTMFSFLILVAYLKLYLLFFEDRKINHGSIHFILAIIVDTTKLYLSKRRRTQMKIFPEIAAEYAPYHTFPAFQRGTED